MRVYNPQSSQALELDLRRSLHALRARRGFDAARYVQAKVAVLNQYMRTSRLDSCVMGVSGGIDSAVVLGLVARARAEKGSPITKIVAALMPVFSDGATNQDQALIRGREIALAFGIEPVVINMSASHGAIKSSVDQAFGTNGEPWASGQLVSNTRTPALYYITSLLTQQEHSGIVVGTTNRDEGSYLGFIGKASDAMVDLQLISDLHKSEVYLVAQYLGIAANVLAATPTGDMYDGRPDEEVFGASYDFVELFLLLKDIYHEGERTALKAAWSEAAREQFDRLANNLDALHRYNRHKYLGRSPAVHLDVMRAETSGGWCNSLYQHHQDPPFQASSANALFTIDTSYVNACIVAPDPVVTYEQLLSDEDYVFLLHNVLSMDEAASLCALLDHTHWVPVGTDGRKPVDDITPYDVGSMRATAYDQTFAQVIWNRIGRFVGSPRVFNSTSQTDWDGTEVWRATSVSPLLRFIKYHHGGALIPHYDAPYIYHEGKRTLVTLVLYLDIDEANGGATRLIRDPQSDTPVSERDLADWPRFAHAADVLLEVHASVGSCLLMDHRVLHDSARYSGEAQKIVLRTDIIFERCGTVPADV